MGHMDFTPSRPPVWPIRSAPPELDAAAVPGRRDRSRLAAVLSAVAFVPAAVVVYVLSLLKPNGAHCLEYGECNEGLPGSWAPGGLWVAAVALVAALLAPWVRVRRAALGVQLAAECTVLLVVLAYP